MSVLAPEAKRAILESKQRAAREMEAAKNARPNDKEAFCQHLRLFVLAKFHLIGEELGTDNLDALVDMSLAHSMKVSPELVKEFDLAQDCEGASSAMAKKTLLFIALQRELEIELPAREAAYVETLDGLCKLAWDAGKATGN